MYVCMYAYVCTCIIMYLFMYRSCHSRNCILRMITCMFALRVCNLNTAFPVSCDEKTAVVVCWMSFLIRIPCFYLPRIGEIQSPTCKQQKQQIVKFAQGTNPDGGTQICHTLT